MTHRVFITTPVPPAFTDRLAGCDVTCFPGPGKITTEALIAAVADVDGLVSTADSPIPDAVLDAPRLRVICNIGVGYDNVDIELAARKGIAVANTPGVLSAAVAELTLGLMIALARHLPESQAIVREGRWGAPGVSAPPGTDLNGKTLGIAGFGRIGREVARRAVAFGMDVVFYDSRADVKSDGFRRADSLDALLAESDFVSLHVDLNPGSRHLIGAEQLALMKPSAYLVNTSRGGVVDQEALTVGLREGRIAGAGLDVLAAEPPAADDPILSAPNVIILPHIGSNTRETRRAMVELALDNLLALLEERPCANVVNRDALRDHGMEGP